MPSGLPCQPGLVRSMLQILMKFWIKICSIIIHRRAEIMLNVKWWRLMKGVRDQPTSTPNLSKFLRRTPSLICTVPLASVLSLCRSRLLWMMDSFLSSGPPPRKNARRERERERRSRSLRHVRLFAILLGKPVFQALPHFPRFQLLNSTLKTGDGGKALHVKKGEQDLALSYFHWGWVRAD